MRAGLHESSTSRSPGRLGFRLASNSLLAMALLLVFLLFSPPRAVAQNTSETPGEEVVANLAAGRVILLVTKDAILIGTIENPIEPQTHVPAPVQMSTMRAGTILGAEDWFSPSSRREIARLDLELPHLRATPSAPIPTLAGAATQEKDAVDLEMVGRGVRRRATEIVQELHGKVDLPPDEPFLEVIVADYIPDYGPEIWQISYELQQEEQTPDYWTTSVSYPSYLQLYPPVKGQPHTLVEFSYPPSTTPTLLDMLRQNDPRFDPLRHSDDKTSEALNAVLEGRAEKLSSAEALPFFRAALEILATPKNRITLSEISELDGFNWIVPPPPEPKSNLRQPEREAGAPSLLHP